MFKLKQLFCAPEGLDTSAFFGGQGEVNEAELPDAGSPEALAQQPPVKDASDGKDPQVDDGTTDEDDQSQPGGKHVPLGALQEERNLRKQLQDRERELVTQNTALLERMTKILELQGQPPKVEQPQVEQLPDFIDDPVGHINGLKAQFQRELQQLQQQLQGQGQHQQQQVQFNQMAATAAAQEASFREVTPDYDAAVAHFQSVKMAEYAAFGFSPEQCAQQLGRDSLALVQHSLSNGKNPAEVLYGMAKALRYAPSATDTTTQQQPAKAPPTSLSSIPAAGRAPDEKGKLTAKDIANMPQDDFDKLFESMRDNATRPAF
jgi:hypothetical protein